MSAREGAKNAKNELNVEELSAIVVGAAFHIHKELGPGLLESVYEAVLTRALTNRGLQVERQKAITFEYEGMRFEEGLRVDLLIDNKLVVELKSVEKLAAATSQAIVDVSSIARIAAGFAD